MPFKCKECGSVSVVFDSLSLEENLVCTSCGVLFDSCSTSFEQNPTCKGTSFVFKDQNTRLSKGELLGLNKIRQLAVSFCLSRDMQDNARSLFSSAYKKMFLKEPIKTKIVLAGCCVYFELRQNQHSVLISDLCEHLQCTRWKFNAVLRSVERLTGRKISCPSAKDLVPAVLRDIAFDKKHEVLRQTVRVLDFCSECWLLSGRSRDSSIIASSYLAWKSINYSHTWINFAKFSSMFAFPKETYSTARKKVKELISVFIIHAEKLPWVSEGTVSKKNISLYIDDVLKYFKSLHKDVISELDCTTGDVDIQAFHKFRPETKCSLTNKSTTNNCDQVPSSECIDSDESISDSEIDRYIRSDEEISAFIEFKKKLDICDSD